MSQDPWDVAGSAKPQPRVYFGQVFTDLFFCVLQKGVGKVPFDATQHRLDDRRTSIKMDLQPLASSGLNFAIQRDMIAESREWAGIVLPSIKALGIEPKAIDEAWVKAELVQTGQSYKRRDTGEEVQKTTFKFLAIYPDEAACEAAAASFFGNGPAEDEEDLAPMPDDEPTNGNGDKQREVAAKFLPALYSQAGGDLTEFSKLIAGNPLTSKYFDLNSPEVAELVASA